MKLNFVTRFNLVMLMVLFVGLALDFAPESARKEVEPIKDELITDILSSRFYRHPESYNFKVNTKHNKYLYDLFIKRSRRLLNKFTLRDTDFKLWCYYTDNNFYLGDTWHNHINTSTINKKIIGSYYDNLIYTFTITSKY